MNFKEKLTILILLILFSISPSFASYDLDELFLSSSIGEPGGVTVEEFIEIIQNVKLSNGRHPEIIGLWKDDNIYTLEIKTPDKINFIFEHLLNYGGDISSLYTSVNDEPAEARYILMTILASPRDETSFDKIRKNKIAIEKEKQKQEREMKESIEKEMKNKRDNEEKQSKKNKILTILNKINGEHLWINSGKYWDGDTSHDDDQIAKVVKISIIDEGRASVEFLSTFNNKIVCKFRDQDAKIQITDAGSYYYGINLIDDKCIIEISGSEYDSDLELSYDENCISQCNLSNAKKMFYDYVYPDNFYEKK